LSALPLVIEPQRGRRLVDWRELWAYRDLLWLMVRRDVKVRYAQTVLGFAWAILKPVITTVLLNFVFNNLAQIQSDGVAYPLFAYAGVVAWTYFAGAFSAATGSLVGNSLLSKVYFPRMILPINPVLSNLVDFAIALLMITPYLIVYRTLPSWQVVVLPLLVGIMVLTAAGAGMWLSALAVQYRDIKLIVSFLVPLLMYASPVVWPVSLLGEKVPHLRLLIGLNPLVGVIGGFRAALIGATPMPWDLIALGALVAAVLFVSGAGYFRHKERAFADVY